MLVVLPVLDGHSLTREALAHLLQKTRQLDKLKVVVWDNASEKPYLMVEFADLELSGLRVEIVRVPVNVGYYQPMRTLLEWWQETEVVALMHNDLMILEQGWDDRLRSVFTAHPKLGMVGFYGSNEIDKDGGGGLGQMYNFDEYGGRGQPQRSPLVADLRPALLLDSIFLGVRPECIPLLKVDQHTPIGHFADRMWCLRLIEHGWFVGVLGVRVAHLGGTSEESADLVSRFQREARHWCEQEGVSLEGIDPRVALYREAERRYLNEFRDQKKMIPAGMHGWDMVRKTV